MNYIVTIYNRLSAEPQRHNQASFQDALDRAEKALKHPRVHKVEISLILVTLRADH